MTRVGSLRDVVEKSTGTRNPAVQPDDEFTYVDVSAIDNQQKIINGARLLLGSEAPSRARKLIRANDVLVSTVRPNLNAVALVPSELDGQVGSTGFCVLRAMPSRALPEYLFYFVRSQRFVDALAGLVAGALYPAVTDSQVLDQELPLPSLSEQRRIVDLLSRAEGIVRLRRQARQKVAALIPAIFVDMFGDPATNPKGLDVVSLGDVLASADYGSSAKAGDEEIGLPMIRMGNVDYSGNVDLAALKYVDLPPAEVARFGLKDGDILFNRTNSKELVGKTGLWIGDREAILASYFIRLRVDERLARPFFVWAFMNTPHMKRVLFDTARGAIGQANINSRELRAFRIPLPALDVQVRFEARCRDVLALRAQQDQATARAEAAFQALLARAFSAASQVAAGSARVEATA
jgi:type I restriction enzyme S subunit